MKPNLQNIFVLTLAALVLVPMLSEAEALGSFTFVHSMNQLRRAHTTALLPDGRVLMVGGVPFVQATIS